MNPDLDVVGNLNQIIQFDTIMNNGIPQCPPINGGIGTDLDVVTNNHPTKLSDLDPFPLMMSKTKTIRANNRPRVDNAIITHRDTVIKGDIGFYHSISANAAFTTNKTASQNPHTGCDLNTIFNHNIRTNPSLRINNGSFSNNSRRMNTHLLPVTRLKQSAGHSKTKIGIIQN